MRILLIEDDEDLCRSLDVQLKHAGYTVDICMDGEDASYYTAKSIHDVILLDRMLPHVDGLTILRKLRETKNHTPVILLTALGELNDKITGLDAGADDYLVKPFAFQELLARIRSIARRPALWQENASLAFGDLTYIPDNNRLSGTLGSCTLSKKEGDLLEFFFHNTGQILSRASILSKVWGIDAEVEEGNLDNYIHFIRRRLKSTSSLVSIRTIRGVGYQLEERHV